MEIKVKIYLFLCILLCLQFPCYFDTFSCMAHKNGYLTFVSEIESFFFPPEQLREAFKYVKLKKVLHN